MAYPISDVTRRVVYTGSAGTGPYSFSFEVLANTDIEVYKNTTLLTLTTDYSVTINANGTGSVTLVSAATGSDNITLVGARAIERTTDFVTGGDLFANTLNDEFDSLVIFAQQISEKADRGLKAPVTDPTDVNMVLPIKASRKGKVLAFDETTGDPVNGPALDSMTTVIAQSANINTVADNIADVNTVAADIPVIDTVAGISANVTTVAGIASQVVTVASNIADIQNAEENADAAIAAKVAAEAAQSAAESARDSTLAAYDSFDDRYLGTKTSDPALDNDGNALVAGALYFNSTAGVMRLYTGSAWVAAYVSGTASSISFSPTGNVAAADVQAAIAEVDSEKLAKASNLSDLSNTATARTNLGLVIGTDVQAYNANNAVTNTAQTFTSAQTFRAANAIRSEAASTQDAIVVAGRAGGSNSYATTLTPATLSANRTVTIPDETFTVGFRNIFAVGTKTGSYTLAVGDVGKYVQLGSGGSITIPTSTFAEGDAISLFNNTAGGITITCSAPTTYIAGTDTIKTSMTLATRGVATVLFISATLCVVSGNVS
jgi:hypothetical protein